MRVELRLAYEASGNLIADKRFGYALACLGDGDGAAAAEMLQQTLEIVPHWASAHYLRGEALAACGDTHGAAQCYSEALRLDPRDRLGCGPRLAALGLAPAPECLPPAYVRALFDQYAGRFDTELVEGLDYMAPWRLRAMLERQLRGRQVGRTLDLGCGTGLMGEACRKMTSWLAGVDLSPEMIAVSASKQVYDHLDIGDLNATLQLGSDRFDLITAADVLVYVGDLTGLIASLALRLEPGGLLAFSCERLNGEGYELRRSIRFAHARTYVESVLQGQGLEVLEIEEGPCRKEAGQNVDAYFVLAQRSLLAPCDIGDADLTKAEKRIS